jgi:hypothetical protein
MNKTLIDLDNLTFFFSLFKEYISQNLKDKLNETDIAEWAKQLDKPSYNASEILMIGDPASLNTKSKYIIDAINEIYDGSAYYLDVDENGLLQPAIGKKIDIDSDGFISIV